MIGHTNTATINERRPLTDNMRSVLGMVISSGAFNKSSLVYQNHKNAMRALLDRGLVSWHINSQSYTATVAGVLAMRRSRAHSERPL